MPTPTPIPRRIERTWKALTLVGAIAAAGFVASTYLARFESQSEAQAAHAQLRTEAVERLSEVRAEVRQQESELRDIKYVNVRIEVAQAQVLDELRLAREMSSDPGTRDERRSRDARVTNLERRIELRGRALGESYARRSIVPVTTSSNDPLTSLSAVLP
jgi:hypothetical protein